MDRLTEIKKANFKIETRRVPLTEQTEAQKAAGNNIPHSAFSLTYAEKLAGKKTEVPTDANIGIGATDLPNGTFEQHKPGTFKVDVAWLVRKMGR